MQSIDPKGEVVQTDVFDQDTKIEKVQERMVLSRSKGATKHLMGEMPTKGKVYIIDGLHYEVKFVDFKRGEVRLKLVGLVKKEIGS